MLFADAVGYSRLGEEQIPLFFEHYVGAIASYNKATRHAPEHIETAGDGMYMVFEDPHAACASACTAARCISGKTRLRVHPCIPAFTPAGPRE
jgi:class 3 adenylate cyclase